MSYSVWKRLPDRQPGQLSSSKLFSHLAARQIRGPFQNDIRLSMIFWSGIRISLHRMAVLIFMRGWHATPIYDKPPDANDRN
jgi:hypothetical protein